MAAGSGQEHVKEEAHGESAFITVGCAFQKTHNKDIHPFPGAPAPNTLTLEIKFLTRDSGDRVKP